MPHVLDQVTDVRGLLEWVQIAVEAADAAFQKTGDPFCGMDYGYKMHDYNQLLSAAARIAGPEVTMLFRPYDLSTIPSPFEIDRVLWRMHLLHVTRTLTGLAGYLETKEPEPIILVKRSGVE